MAAAADMRFCVSATRSGFGWPDARPSVTTATPRWDELDLDTQLRLIARTWILTAPTLLSARHDLDHHIICKPLVLPDPTPKRSRLPAKPCDDDLLPDFPTDPAEAGQSARQRNLSCSVLGCPSPAVDDSRRRREQRRDPLINDPTPGLYLDLTSDEGVIQHAKKKGAKKSQPQAFNWGAELNKDAGGGADGGAGGDQNGDAGKTGGDAGGDGNGDGKGNGDDKDKDKDKKDKDKEKEKEKEKDEEKNMKEEVGAAKVDETWGSFEPVGKKKKKGKNLVEEKTEPMDTPIKSDTFHEIKLDDTKPSLDLDFGGSTPDSKSGLLSTWGGSWVKGGLSSWLSGKDADKPKDTEEKRDDFSVNLVADTSVDTTTHTTPWSIDRPKPKKKDKTTMSFGGFDEVDLAKSEKSLDKKDEGFDFSFGSTSKDKKNKTSVWGMNPEFEEKKDDPPAESQDLGSGAADDAWGSNAWGTSTSKKKGKKGATTLAPAPAPAPEKIEPVIDTTPAPDNDFLAPTSKKSKKKKKGAIEEVKEPEPPAPEPVPEPELDPEPVQDDVWDDPWNTAKKSKKKNILEESTPLSSKPEPKPFGAVNDAWGWGKTDKKKGIPEEPVSPPDPKPEIKEVDDFWGSIAKKEEKKKKSSKNIVDLEPVAEPVVEPLVKEPVELETKLDESWGVPTTKKSKKKKGKATDPVPEPVPELEPELERGPTPPPEPEKKADDDLMDWPTMTTTKKKGKKGKTIEVPKEPEPEREPEPVPVPPAEPEKEDDWGGTWGVAKKDKKKKKGVVDEPRAADPQPPEPEPIVEPEPPKKEVEDMLSFGSTSKDKKKSKKGKLEPPKEPERLPTPEPEPVPEPEPEIVKEDKPVEDVYRVTSSKKDKKKKKKGGVDEPPPAEPELAPIPDPEPETEPEKKQDFGGDDWGSWDTAASTKDKKKKKGILDAIAPKEQAPEPVLETPSSQFGDDTWGTSTSKKDKKKKAAKNATIIEDPPEENVSDFQIQEPDPKPEPEPSPKPRVEEPSSVWSFWGAKKTNKKPKEDPLPPTNEENNEGWLDWGKKKTKALIDIKESEQQDLPPAVPEAPSAVGDDDFWDTFGADKTNKTGSGSLMPDSIEEPKHDDSWGFATTSKKDKKKKGSKNIPIEIENGSHLNGVKPDSVEESKGGKGEDDSWGWGSLSKSKTSPPPAPTPPSLDMSLSGQELEENVWDDTKVEVDEKAAAEAAELAAEIAAEEAELATLTKKMQRKKLTKTYQKRFDELTERANQRADEAAAKEADEAAQREAEEKAEAEALEAEQKAEAEAKEAEERAATEAREAEERAVAEALEAEIAAEEAELAALTKKQQKKKLTRTFQKRFDELTERAQARADEKAAKEAEGLSTPESDGAAQEAEEEAAREAEEAAAREAADQAAKEAEEQAAWEAEEQAREAEEQAKREREEAEAEAKKKSKKSSKGGKLSKKEKELEKEREREKEREKEKEQESFKYDDDDDDLDLDNIDLAPEQVDEILSGFASPKPPPPKAEPFSFWGAKPKSSLPDQASGSKKWGTTEIKDEIKDADSFKFLEDATVEDAPSSYKATTFTDDDWMKPKKTKTKVKGLPKIFSPAHSPTKGTRTKLSTSSTWRL
ncbi:hypothetical protein GGR54DRAFT_526260 [Hypoxylon sp. NC1633]|nr:hypothetical protein GGR54DRAFT_526260 [Hypoxylon sp. NC1633]